MPVASPLFALHLSASALAAPSPLHPDVSRAVQQWAADGKPDTLTDERVTSLAPLVDWMVEQQAHGTPGVCVHPQLPPQSDGAGLGPGRGPRAWT